MSCRHDDIVGKSLRFLVLALLLPLARGIAEKHAEATKNAGMLLADCFAAFDKFIEHYTEDMSSCDGEIKRLEKENEQLKAALQSSLKRAYHQAEEDPEEDQEEDQEDEQEEEVVAAPNLEENEDGLEQRQKKVRKQDTRAAAQDKVDIDPPSPVFTLRSRRP